MSVDNLTSYEEIKKRAAASSVMFELLNTVVKHPEQDVLQKSVKRLIDSADQVEVEVDNLVRLSWSESMEGWGYKGQRRTTLAIGMKGISSIESGVTVFVSANAEVPWLLNKDHGCPVGEMMITVPNIQSVDIGDFSDNISFKSGDIHLTVTDKGRVFYRDDSSPQVQSTIY